LQSNDTRASAPRVLTARLQANNGKERKDLYTDNWDGDVYKGACFRRVLCSTSPPTLALRLRCVRSTPLRSACLTHVHSPLACAGSRFNILNLLILAFVLTPFAGLAFAYWSYGTLWG